MIIILMIVKIFKTNMKDKKLMNNNKNYKESCRKKKILRHFKKHF